MNRELDDSHHNANASRWPGHPVGTCIRVLGERGLGRYIDGRQVFQDPIQHSKQAYLTSISA